MAKKESKLSFSPPKLTDSEKMSYEKKFILASENPRGEMLERSEISMPKFYQLRFTPDVKSKLERLAWFKRKKMQALIMDILLPEIDRLYKEVPEEFR